MTLDLASLSSSHESLRTSYDGIVQTIAKDEFADALKGLSGEI